MHLAKASAVVLPKLFYAFLHEMSTTLLGIQVHTSHCHLLQLVKCVLSSLSVKQFIMTASAAILFRF